MQINSRQLTVQVLAFLAGIVSLHYLCLYFFPKPDLDPYGLSDFYPLSVFQFRFPSLIQALAGLGLILAGWLGAPWMARPGKSWATLAGLGLSLALALNLLAGWRFGIDYPTATTGDTGIEYYHDAVLITSPAWLLAKFNEIQPHLLEHARTHPPGPVLYYYFLNKLFQNPGLISIANGAIAIGLFAWGWLLLSRRWLGADKGQNVLAMLLPALLIYSIGVMDAVMAGFFLVSVALFVKDETPRSAIWAGLWLALALFFTFGALFLLPVLVGMAWFTRRLDRVVIAVGTAIAVLALLLWFSDFNWWIAFRKAAALENEGGFLLFAHPRRYVWYRIGSAAEIWFFFTPFLGVLAWRGMGLLRQTQPMAWRMAWLALATLTAMLLAGMLKIGEAARVCIFITPYLLLPAAFAWKELETNSQTGVIRAMLGWVLVMQLFGFYQW